MNLTLCPGVTTPFHYHPAINAAYISYLDQEPRGKAFLMIGRGAFHDIVGITIEDPIRAVREAIVIIDNLIHGRKSTRLNSSHRTISYAVFCLKKKND